MPSLNLLVVGDEKELPDFEEALEGCKRYVGPIKLFSAHKAVDAVGRLTASLCRRRMRARVHAWSVGAQLYVTGGNRHMCRSAWSRGCGGKPGPPVTRPETPRRPFRTATVPA